MIKYNHLLLLMLSFLVMSCHSQSNSDTSIEIDSYLEKMMDQHDIPGLALAVIQDEEVVYKKYFGKSSLEDNSPVNQQSLFRIFSATKLITSTAVFQLIEQGEIDLDDHISEYFDDLPSDWHHVQIVNLLTHSSGIPDIIRLDNSLSDEGLFEALAKEEMYFKIGEQFQYNQTNYWLLAQIVEKITGSSFDEFVLQNQFEGGNDGVLFSSNSLEDIPNRAIRYYYNPKTKAFERDTNNNHKRGHSGNGLNITLDEFIKWNTRLDSNVLIDNETKAQMWAPFDFGNRKDVFNHGWGAYPVNSLKSVGFTGGNLAAFRKFNDQGTTIVLLSNGYRIAAYDIIINDVARLVIPELKAKTLSKESEVMELVFSEQYEEAQSVYRKIQSENPSNNMDNLRWNINEIGNTMYSKGLMEASLSVFKLNAAANPNWWVAIAGIAEGYESVGEMEKAVDNYKIALRLNTNNEFGYNELMKGKIKELGEK